MTQQDSGQRRREEDLKLEPEATDDFYPGNDRRHSLKPVDRTPGKSFLRRFKQPIIGLSIAGAAAPLINAGAPETPKLDQNSTAQPTEADQARLAAAAKNGDAEEQLANRIATESGASSTSSFVGDAMSKYDIEEDLARDIYDIAQKEGIDPEVAFGLVKTESSFKNKATSHVGARGLTQVMPRTAKWMVPGTKAEDLYNQKTNLTLGFRYLNQMIDKYKGNVRLALLAYNRGPGTVDKILKRGGDPNNGYADKVLQKDSDRV